MPPRETAAKREQDNGGISLKTGFGRGPCGGLRRRDGRAEPPAPPTGRAPTTIRAPTATARSTQITAKNVGTLQQVWSFHLKPAGYTGRLREDEAIPIVIGNTMYLASPYGAVHRAGRHDRRGEMEISASQQRPAVEARRRRTGRAAAVCSRRRSSSGRLSGGLYSIKASDGTLERLVRRERRRQPQDA